MGKIVNETNILAFAVSIGDFESCRSLSDKHLSILLTKEKDFYVLPSKELEEDETLYLCADNILYNETGLKNVYKEQLYTFSDINRVPGKHIITTSYIALLDKEKVKKDLEKGKYFMIVLIFIENDNHEFLIQKTSKEKGGMYAITGGHVSFGDNNIKTVIKEAKEELGININEKEIKYIDTIKHDIAFCDTFYIHQNINLDDITLQKEEVENIYWLTKEEIYKLDKEGKFRHRNIYNFEKVLKYIEEDL